MQFPSPVSVQWIADFINAKISGNKIGNATGINELHKVEKGDLVFVDHPKYYNTCINMKNHAFKNSLDQKAKSGIQRCLKQ